MSKLSGEAFDVGLMLKNGGWPELPDDALEALAAEQELRYQEGLREGYAAGVTEGIVATPAERKKWLLACLDDDQAADLKAARRSYHSNGADQGGKA